ncbi:hypothetical protein BH10PAT3_BH10PAT3_2550 [soil metagenome]
MLSLKHLLSSTKAQRHNDREAELYRSLIRREAKIGGEIFGALPKGGRREFFCLDEHTWIWHEEWIDESGQRQIKTTRYDIRPTGILKAQDGQTYQNVTIEEAERLFQASKVYEQRIRNELYAAYI